MIIGLTGGIASGKSVVSNAFAGLGVPVVDTDLISRELVAPGSEALTEIQQAFNDVVDSDGVLNRQTLRAAVFEDKSKRKRLETILHPRIRAVAFDRAHASEQDHSYVIMVVPLLLESGYDSALDRVLVVDATETQQRERLILRDGLSVTQAHQIMAAQLDRDVRKQQADDIIDASQSLKQTQTQVEALHKQYLRMANAST